MRLLAAFLVLALAGCTDPTPPASDGSAPFPTVYPGSSAGLGEATPTLGPDGSLLYETTSWRDTIDLTLPYGVPFAPYDQQDPKRLTVGEDVTAILVEVAWDDPTADLNAYAVPDSCPSGLDVDAECEVGVTTRTAHWYEARGGTPGGGDSPSRLFLSNTVLAGECLRCDWTFGAHTETAAAQVVADIYVTMFHGEFPDGFTAIPT